MSDDPIFKHPFSFIMSGTSGSSKTSFCIHLLQNLDALCTGREFASGIIWCLSEKTAVPERQQFRCKNVKYNEGVPESFGGGGGGKPCLVMLGDMLNDVYSKQLCDLFTRGSHQKNISVILITQNLFH